MTRLRKKKKKSHSSSDRAKVDNEVTQREKEREIEEKTESRDTAAQGSSSGGSKKTDAERRFEEIQRKRVSLSAFLSFSARLPQQWSVEDSLGRGQPWAMKMVADESRLARGESRKGRSVVA